MAGLAYPDYLHHNNSNYALVDESELRGSFRTITSKDDRNNIPSDKRALGAVVTWITDNVRYTKQYTGTDLTNINWQNDDNWSDFGGGSSGDITKYFYDIVNDKGRIDYSNIVNAPTISGSLGYNSVSIDSVVNDVFEKGTSNTVTITSNVVIDSGITISNAILNKTTNGIVTSESISLVSGVNTLTTTLTDTTKLVISFTITKDTLSTTITSNIYTVNFVYPYFYGVSNTIYTGSDVYNNLNKEVSIKNYAKKYSYTLNNQYFYFAYPIEYGSLLSILELSSNFNIKDDFTISTVTVNNSNWSHSYYLVRSSSLYTITAKSIKYILYESDINVVSTLQIFTPITNGDGTKYLSDDGSYKTVSGGLTLPISATSLTAPAIRLSDNTSTEQYIGLYSAMISSGIGFYANTSSSSAIGFQTSGNGLGLDISSSSSDGAARILNSNSSSSAYGLKIVTYSNAIPLHIWDYDLNNTFNVYGNGSIMSRYLKTLTTSSGGNYLGIDTSTGLFKTMSAPTSSSPISVTGTYTLSYSAGAAGINGSYSNYLGYYAGSGVNVSYSNFIGNTAGASATGCSYSNFIGNSAGINAMNSLYSNFIGNASGLNAINSSYSNFIGYYAGTQVTSSYSTLIGYRVGYLSGGYPKSIGNNNIIIGTNITLPESTANSINIGAVLFGTGCYSTTSDDPSYAPISGGKIGIGIVSPSYTLDVNGITQATQFKLSALNTAPSSATATGTIGEIRIVNGYIYVCVATNTWQRSALTTW